jgi:hypothetical protein
MDRPGRNPGDKPLKMEIQDITKNLLTSNPVERWTLSNAEFNELNNSDDIREADVWFDASPGWIGGFKIFFNGALIASFKTFPAFEKRLTKLSSDWNLTTIGPKQW